MSVPLSIDIKTTGGPQAKAQLDQVGRSINTVGMQAQKSGGMMDRLAQTFTAKRAMIFSLSGIVASGVEAIGMFSLLGDSQAKVTKITEELTQMQKEGKEGTKEFADASRELEGAQRALRFQLRLTVLSAFDLLPFTINFISSLVRMKAENLANAAASRVAAQANTQLAASHATAAGAANLQAGATTRLAAEMAIVRAEITAAGLGMGLTAKQSTALTSGLILTEGGMIRAGAATKGFSAALLGITRVLGPIALIIGGIVLAVEAWKNNWGGFGDAVNQAGVQIGNIHPILKQTMELIAKLGESIHALVTFDFGKLGEIWGGQKFMSTKTNKALDDATKTIEEFRIAAVRTLSDLSKGNRSEQRDFLKSIGVTGNEKEHVKDALDSLEEIDSAMLSLNNTMDTMETLSLMERLGFGKAGMTDEVFDDAISSLADQFKNIGKKFEIQGVGKDIFEQFADVLETASEQGQQKGTAAIMAFLDKNPDFMTLLKARYPDLAKAIEGMITAAGEAVDPAVASKAIGNAFTTGSILDPNAGEGVTTFDKNGNPINTPRGGGLGQKIIDALTQSFTGANANKVGLAFRKNIILPLIDQAAIAGGELGAAISNAFATFDFATSIASLNAAIGTGGNIIGNFIAGVFGFTSAEAMRLEIDNFFTNTIPIMFRVGWTNFTTSLKEVFSLGNIAGAIFNVGGFINTILLGLFGGLSDISTQVHEWLAVNVVRPIMLGWQGIMNEIGTAITSVSSGIDLGIDWLGNILGGIFGGISNIFTEVHNWLAVNVIRPIMLAWQGIVDLITSIFTVGETTVDGKDNAEGKGLIDQIIDSLLGGIFGTAHADDSTITEGTNVPIQFVVTTNILQASEQITAVAQTIIGLGNLKPQINLQSSSAGTVLSAVANTILGLQNLQPQISLQNQNALNLIATTGQRIADLENLEPQISLQNDEALDAVQEVEDEIMALEDLNPTVTVTVKTEGAKSEGDFINAAGFAKGGIVSAARGKMWTAHGEQTFRVGDNVGGVESIAFIPHNDPYPIVDKILERFGYGGRGINMGISGSRSFGGGGGGGETPNIIIFLDGQRMRNSMVKSIIKDQAGYH